MGCCFSRNHEASEQTPPPKLPEKGISRLSPPISPQLEEETVKEVLSETPSQKRPSFTKLEEQKLSSTILPSFPKSEVSEEEEEEEKKIEKQQVPCYTTTPTTTQDVSVSGVSEICSLSESYSTTTLTKEDVEEGEVRQQLRTERSPSKIPQRRSSNNKNPNNDYQYGISGADYHHHHRERRSPVRRSSEQPSPRNDNNKGFKFGLNNTDMGQRGRRQPISTTNNNNNRSWRDPGESSGRRSRSPSITRNSNNESMGQNKSGCMGRSPSAKTGRSPARIPPMASENSSKSETGEVDGEGNGNESLENPLVSLECFIFL